MRPELPRGEQQHAARLTDADVIWIRTCGLTLVEMARRLGVGVMTVCDARRGLTWAHVDVRYPYPTGR